MNNIARPLLLAALVCAAVTGFARASESTVTMRAKLPDIAVRAFERLPIQEGGRVKPIASFARFTLISAAGTTSPVDIDGRKNSAGEWLLRLALFPELAQDDPVILVEDSQALTAVGLATEDHKKRDRWSYGQLVGSLPDLLDRAHASQGIDAKQRTAIQLQTERIAESALTVLRLGRTFDFARHRMPTLEGTRLAAIFPGREAVSVADVIEKAPTIVALERELAQSEDGRERGTISALWRNAAEMCADAQILAWVPPVHSAAESPDWMTPADLLLAARRGQVAAPEHVALLRAVEDVVSRRTDPERLGPALENLVGRVERLADARGELGPIGLEVTYQRLGLLSWSTALFLLGFALCCLAWLRARSICLRRAAWIAAGSALALLGLAIVMRCTIRGRPPVSTLYETVLFVTATSTLVALVVERIQRQRLHLALACLVGAGGLFLAYGYEVLDGKDTMPSLVAVLDTNFWLATHVTAITLGYASGLLAAILGSTYVLIALVRGPRANREQLRGLARSVYGSVCFALLFAVVGTILGGIWANESWGRFWGWDPKENGALLICLTMIAIVHARRSGMLRELGTSVAAAFGGTVVAFSWWGVNLLGVGLHSYGFTSGIHRALWTYYVVQWSVVALGGLVWFRRRSAARDAIAAAGHGRADDARPLAALEENEVPVALPRPRRGVVNSPAR